MAVAAASRAGCTKILCVSACSLLRSCMPQHANYELKLQWLSSKSLHGWRLLMSQVRMYVSSGTVAGDTASMKCSCCERDGHACWSVFQFTARLQLQASTAGQGSPPSGKLSRAGCPEAALLPCPGQWCAAARPPCRTVAWPGSSVMTGNAEHVRNGHALCCGAKL